MPVPEPEKLLQFPDSRGLPTTAVDPRGIMGIRDIEIERVSTVHHSKIGLEPVVELFDETRAE